MFLVNPMKPVIPTVSNVEGLDVELLKIAQQFAQINRIDDSQRTELERIARQLTQATSERERQQNTINQMAETLNSSVMHHRSGSVVQVQYAQIEDTYTVETKANELTVIDEISCSITPVYPDSIIKVDVVFSYESSHGSSYNNIFLLNRNGEFLGMSEQGNKVTGIGVHSMGYYSEDSKSTMDSAKFSYFDTPNTSNELRYSLALGEVNLNQQLHINKTVLDLNSKGYERAMSTICATEIRA